MPRERAAAHRDAAALHVHLPEELGIEVAELRPGDHERVTGRRALRRDRGSRSTSSGAARAPSTLASSTTALPAPGAPAVCGPYGNAFASVVGAAGSFCWRRSLKTERPFAAPSFVLQRREELRAARLVAAARPEPRAQETGRRDRRRCASTARTSRLDALRCALIPATYASMSASSRLAALRRLRQQRSSARQVRLGRRRSA